MGLFRKSALANAMAVGKNKRLTKGRKGKGKKIVDPFTKKDWYDIKAPSLFTNKLAGKTPVTRTLGTKIASDGLKGRVFEICLADLNKDEDQAYRKIKLCCDKCRESTASLTSMEWTSRSTNCVRW